MDYIQRELERKFLSMSSVFKAVMVTGARQVGKSTMLKRLAAGQDRTYVSMDNARDRELAQADPKLFFQTYKPPVLIDEAQKAPELFETIKIICDNTEERGLFWLTGSQSKKLLKQAGDSLAGRICILKMYSLSQRELLHIFPEEPLDFSFAFLKKRSRLFPENNILSVFSHIWRGGMPEMVSLDNEQASEYWNSYIDTYLMRDAVDDNGITDVVGFRKFLRACAAFSGQLLNYSDLAAAADVSGVTAKEWVKVLQSMGIIFLLEPYYNNELKRLVKTPKLYFCDTGLCAFLSSWTSRDALMNGAVAGHYFENYVVGEMLRTFSYGKNQAAFSFYRDKDQREIDLLVEQDGVLHPLEIKKSAEPNRRTVKVFSLLQKAGRPIGTGGIVCMTDTAYPIDLTNSFIPANLI
ncbi:MAG: ATP-binding protein [Acidaminococcaceae bacterium]|nr:ATP-binding protein [Acidaminococcaceae bacterium]